ncbi:bifunctional 4-hydroxy-2-oxoglutarate aldolase/2-dehydro-3-deoxy-phosphogluconate aldolase [Dermabacteraceae bacterium P13101]
MSTGLTLQTLTERKIVPVVVVNDAANANGLADALAGGGLPVAEVTFRTEAAAESIKIMAARGDLIVGAGTVIKPQQVDIAADNGAQFIVSPGLLPEVIERAQEKGLIVLPGAVTPGEIMRALSLGLDTVKFFPAATYGGPAALKSLSAPFPGVSFLPTGGVNAQNAADYLALPCVNAVGGSWMVPAKAVNAGDFANVEHLVREAVAGVAHL